jgi:hypothetical protein
MQRYIVVLFIAALLVIGGSILYRRGLTQTGDKPRLQRASCVNNLKQIGLAFRVWAGDHGNKYPFNVSTNAEGTSEFCVIAMDNFDSNVALHLQVMANELRTPKILICPKDSSKIPAANFDSLRAENVTYKLRTNFTNTNAKEILMVCPIDGNILYSDGTVKGDETGFDDTDGHHPMRVPAQ